MFKIYEIDQSIDKVLKEHGGVEIKGKISDLPRLLRSVYQSLGNRVIEDLGGMDKDTKEKLEKYDKMLEWMVELITIRMNYVE